ncbi:hypothetical protein NKH18_47650 [Streptomyces sp. M10(2022)]
MDAARRGGILNDDDTLDLGAELDTHIAGRVAARRSELQEVQDLLGAFKNATKDQEREQEHCDAASGELTETERQSAAAAEKLTTARVETGQELDDFIGRWSGSDDTTVLVPADGDVLRAAIGTVEEPEAAPLPEVFHNLVDRRRTHALSRVETLKRQHSDIAEALRASQAERDTVAAEGDDAPSSDLRPASRDERPGARCGSSYGSPITSPTTTRLRWKAPCTRPACSPPGCTPTLH